MKNLKRLTLEVLCLAVLGLFYLWQSKSSLQERLVDELMKKNIQRQESVQEFEYEDFKNRFKLKTGTIEAIVYKWEIDDVIIGYREKVEDKEASISIPSVLLFYAPKREELCALKVRDAGLDGLNKKVYPIESFRKHVIIKKRPIKSISNLRRQIPKRKAIGCLEEDNETVVRERYGKEKDRIYQLGDLVNNDGWTFDEPVVINGERGFITREERRTVNKLYNQQIEETIKDIHNRHPPVPKEEGSSP